MNLQQVRSYVDLIERDLIRMKEIISSVNEDIAKTSGIDNIPTKFPKQDEAVQRLWDNIQKNVPPGFSLDGNLVRHLSFNEPVDWLDISSSDIPRELKKIEEYRQKLFLVEYVESLHSEVARLSGLVIDGDLEAALKAVFTLLDTRIRSVLKPKNNESTVATIGKAFKNGALKAPPSGDNESVRNFLQGVLGYYRGSIVHNPLPTYRNRIESSLSLFALAHEAFVLFDLCVKDDSDEIIIDMPSR